MSISDRINKINQVRKQMVVLPISKIQLELRPATTNEDNVRKLMDTDPFGYTSHLLQLIYQCVDFTNAKEFITDPNGKPIPIPKGEIKPKFPEFISNISYYDREMLFWGLAKATYGDKILVDNSPCSNKKCKHPFPTEITCTKLLDSLSLTWDRPEHFNDFLYQTSYIDEESQVKYTCHMKMLSLKDELELSNVGEDEAKENFDKYGNVYTPLDQFKQSVKKIEIESVLDKTDPDYFHESEESNSEVLRAISCFNKNVIDEIVTNYFTDILSKYQYFFKQDRTCPKCGETHPLPVPMFVFFFQRFRTI